MKKSEEILKIIAKNTVKENNTWKHQQLYRQLYNEDLYLLAYDIICKNEGSMTQGIDNETLDGFNKNLIQKIIEELKTEQYRPKPVKRIEIPKKNGKTRQLGIPTIKDRLIQKVVQLILESIYEPIMLDCNHGFRPNKSCHTALSSLIKSSTGVKWWIEGDITSFFDNINHNILINILRKKIKDERFLNLIRKFLNAGFVSDFKYENTYSGTPQGGIISPLLANIYLNEFDEYIMKIKRNFDKGKYRKANPEYTKIRFQKQKIEKYLEENPDANDKDDMVKQIKKLKMQRRNLPSADQMDRNFKRLIYVRYADDWVIGVIGNKEDCKNLKEDIQQFLKDKLNLELSNEKTKITNAQDSISFLGYQIKKYKNTNNVVDANKKRIMSEKFGLYISIEQCKNFFIKNGMLQIENGKFKSKELGFLSIKEDIEIVNHYNGLIRGYYNYFSLANNIYILGQFQFIFEESFMKTMACKYKTTKGKMFIKYKKNKKITVYYKNSKGQKIPVELYHDGYKKKQINKENDIDIAFNPMKYATRTKLTQRLQANKCELCGSIEGPFEVHHINKMKNIKDGKTEWEKLMIARKRKTLVVCKKCHKKIHCEHE